MDSYVIFNLFWIFNCCTEKESIFNYCTEEEKASNLLYWGRIGFYLLYVYLFLYLYLTLVTTYIILW